MDRKRQKAPDPVETLQERPIVAKQAKLVLKPPKFITERQKQEEPVSASSVLDDTLQLENAEVVVDHLLELLNSHKLEHVLKGQVKWTPEEVSRCIGSIGKLAKMYRQDVSLCCVLVHVVEKFGLVLRDNSDEDLLPKNFQLFVLSLADHGESVHGGSVILIDWVALSFRCPD